MSTAQLALVGTVLVYGLLAVLLLSLNIFSLWRWWVKAGATILTGIVFIAAYLVISGLIGWPSESQLPPRFKLLNSQIEEPDKTAGKPGHIYLWVEEVDEHQVVISPPRAYAMPFTTETTKGVTKSQEMLDQGQDVLGETKTQPTETSSKKATSSEQGTSADDLTAEKGQTNNSTGGSKANAAGGIFGFPGGQTVNFTAMPPVDLPTKPPPQ